MATSFKAVVLRHQVRRDGTYGIKIRLTHNQRSKYINTGLVVTEDDITPDFQLKKRFFIAEVEKLIKEYRSICNKNAAVIKDMDVWQVFDLITKKDGSELTFIVITNGQLTNEEMLKDIDFLVKKHNIRLTWQHLRH
ncbi:MAG: hypothetical protein FWG84_07915 [Bacteroidales bacterium]|nr:hypothetical protein [Bacteroidales bacterium]